MSRRGRTPVAIESVDSHPNFDEITGVLARLPHIGDADLPKLAAAWHNTVFLADARDKSLRPTSPLVLEVLTAFEAVQALFADDVEGDEDYVTVDPQIATVALKAVRDAIAAAYARPVLARTEHAALMRAWREVFPNDSMPSPQLGERHEEVQALLAALPGLASRCHDTEAAARYNTLLAGTSRLDEGVRSVARNEAWRAAVLTSRRRVWGLVRRSGAEGFGRYCNTCRRRNVDDSASWVLALTLDAACALLVADAIDDNLVDVLTLPVQSLIPAQRTNR